MELADPAVETYPLTAANGRHIRQATKVTFPDGRVVKFGERVPKRMAIQQARELLEREAARAAKAVSL